MKCLQCHPIYPIKIDSKRWDIHWQDRYEKSLLLFITGRCNLHCTNCFSVYTRSSVELSLEQVERILSANPSYSRVDLMGGEPLLYPNIPSLLRLLRDRNKRVSIYTNGILLPTLFEEPSPLRVCVSFHEITSKDPSRKPLVSVTDNLERFCWIDGNNLTLVFLMDQQHVTRAMEIIDYIDYQMPFVNKLTVGLMRYENDYWNDNCPGVLPFADYAKAVQRIVDAYNGRLNLDIFLKGVLDFPGDSGSCPHRVNRFQCVFQDMTYSDCLYNACDPTHPMLNPSCRLPQSRSICKHTGTQQCLADKVRLVRLHHAG